MFGLDFCPIITLLSLVPAAFIHTLRYSDSFETKAFLRSTRGFCGLSLDVIKAGATSKAWICGGKQTLYVCLYFP